MVPGPDWQRLVDVTPQSEFLLAVVGLAGVTHPADYICGAAGNAALDALAKSAGKHSIQHGVRVLAVHPGPALTDRMITRGKAAARKRYGDEGRWQELLDQWQVQQPPPVADMVVVLASPRSRHLSRVMVNLTPD